MNENIILKMVEPYLKDKVLTYKDFYQIFSFLSIREQYKVTDILDKNYISLEPDENEEELQLEIELDSDFEIRYDQSIFSSTGKDDDEKGGYLPVNTNIKQGNDVLCRLIQEGNEIAAQDMCIKNRRLVGKYANGYCRYFGNDLDYDDLEQAGMIGLLKAAERFDYVKGTSFSTYAVFWIRQAIIREIDDKGFRIRVPVHAMEAVSKVTKIDNELGILGYSFKERIIEISNRTNLTPEKVCEYIAIRNNILSYTSLNTPVGEEEDIEMLDFIADEELSVEDTVFRYELVRVLRETMESLTAREQRVLSLRFGLDDGKDRTLDEIGKMFFLTRERIRQIEAKAIRKMRHPSRSKKIKDFL